MRGSGKHSLQPHTHRLRRSTSHTWFGSNILSMDSAITPTASRRMTGTTFQMRGVFFKAIHTFFRCLSNCVLSQWLCCDHQKIYFCHSTRMNSLLKIAVLTILQEIENTFSPGEKVPVRADEGFRNSTYFSPIPTDYDGPPLTLGLGPISCQWILRLRLRLHAEWQELHFKWEESFSKQFIYSLRCISNFFLS